MKSYSALKRCVSLAVVLLASLMLIPLGGCMNTGLFGHTRRPQLNAEESRAAREDILNHLEEKYGMFFSGSSLFANYADEQSIKFWRPSSSDKSGVAYRSTEGTCFRRVNSDGTITYSDNFAYKLFKPLYQEKVEALAKETVKLPEYAIKVSFSPCAANSGALPENIRSVDDLEAFEEILHDGDRLKTPILQVDINVPESDSTAIDLEALMPFEQSLKGLAFSGILNLTGLDPEYYAKNHFNDSGHRWNTHLVWGFADDVFENTGGANDVWEDITIYK